MNLSQVRKKKGLTQNKLASLSGIPATVISNFETGVRTPSLKNLYRLKEALGCSWDELLNTTKKQKHEQ